jgi:5-formyltetrahydrofolate cyclo-ligase
VGTRNAPSDAPSESSAGGEIGAPRDVRCSSATARHCRSIATRPGDRDYVLSVRSKDQVRRAVWRAMDREGVSRFPGAEGRIPNFAGAKLAAQKLAAHRQWKRAKVVKANPDSPQTHGRRLALEEGKQLVMAVPRLRDKNPFRLLDPKRLTKRQVREAATIKGALRHGRVVALEEMPQIDFVLCGSVAVNLNGARIGKGGGFSDLEYGMLIDAGKIGARTVVATTVHPIQILREHLMVTDHDLPVDLIATPRAVIEVERAYDRPRGILWDHLQPPQIHEIPLLERMGYA